RARVTVKAIPETKSLACSARVSRWIPISIWWAPTSSCDPDSGGRAPDREAQEEVRDEHGDDGGADRLADRDADAGRAARGGVAVVAVDQDDRDREDDQLQEAVEDVDRWQEGQEVVVVRPARLPVHQRRDQPRAEVGGAQG